MAKQPENLGKALKKAISKKKAAEAILGEEL